MPSIDYSGQFFVVAKCHDKGSRGAIRFPVKASTAKVAIRFANKKVLELLPGWGSGSVSVRKGDKWVSHHRLVH